MDALALLKQAWPYVTGFVAVIWTLYLYRENRDKEKAKHDAEIAAATAAGKAGEANAKNDATRLAADIANETMRYQQEELKTARSKLADNLKMELQLRRALDKHEHEIEALERVNGELRERIAFLEAEIKRQAEQFQLEIKSQGERATARIMQLEGELAQQKQIVDSARRNADRGTAAK